jgi:hypothetical protein
MTSLNNQHKQLLFDYCVGLTSEKESAKAEELIASSTEAAEIHSRIEAALAPLKALESEHCPDELAEGTIWRLNSNHAASSQLRLQELLAAEQAAGVAGRSRFWWKFGKMAAAAAVILIAAGIWSPSLNFARQRYWQRRCQMQLGRIFQGLSNYISDHDGRMPAVVTTAGAPWWKIGQPGNENHSNTRNMYLLVKGNYVGPANFVCPGKRERSIIHLVPSQVQVHNDFPSRGYVSYSFRIRCNGSKRPALLGRKVLIADLSPLFESLPDDFSKPFKLRLNRDLLASNSINHNRRGQNVLFRDGNIKFIKKRHADISLDDIFTLREMCVGCEVRGCELPSSQTDAFLAP